MSSDANRPSYGRDNPPDDLDVWFINEMGQYENRTRSADGTFARERTSSSRYREVFLDAYGDDPAICSECRSGLWDRAWIVHHVDHDHWNHDPSNLVAMCRGCHQREHMQGVKQSDETVQKRVAGFMNYIETRSDEAKQRQIERWRRSMPDMKGHRKHEGFSNLQSKAQHTSRMRHCECGLSTNAGAMANHTRKTGHAFTK